MLKISRVETADQAITLKLEGRVVGLWADELLQACARFVENGRALKLDLRDVSFADRHGLSALLSLKAQGATIESPSPFVAEQLKGPQPTKPKSGTGV